MESLDDDLNNIHVSKYVDDITLIETIPKHFPYQLTEENSVSKQIIHPENTQTALDSIAHQANMKHMQINTHKKY